MSLPEFPLHESGQCDATATLERINNSADADFEQARRERENPFREALAGLGSSESDDQEPDQ